jgi:ABC-type methionine transport system ATPase subunit
VDVSYLFITHNIGVVEYMVDEVVVMRRGCVEERGSSAEARLADVGLHPQPAGGRSTRRNGLGASAYAVSAAPRS